ncbi:hypothetical protein HY772_06940 [Candidatus Woesearchaeota archaeon]|nr:hypothetical protein [Candidatus Woesearchaeota archaeon]
MLKDLLAMGKKPAIEKKAIEKKGLPKKEIEKKYVSAQRFNEMIDYYTAELQSRLKEVEDLKAQHRLLINTSVKSNEKADCFSLEARKLREEIRVLQQRLAERVAEKKASEKNT